MTFRRTVRFKQEFKLLPAELRQTVRAKFQLFSRNWRHPSLHLHKLEGMLWRGQQVFDLWVTEKYRVLFVIDRDVVGSVSIGTHGIVSK
ncbi:MAG: hypothetical protein HY043_18310 [Verrucomicrobia bacterium]|nr:hypothetical protein [Verrucomicrobiota bacterium]